MKHEIYDPEITQDGKAVDSRNRHLIPTQEQQMLNAFIARSIEDGSNNDLVEWFNQVNRRRAAIAAGTIIRHHLVSLLIDELGNLPGGETIMRDMHEEMEKHFRSNR